MFSNYFVEAGREDSRVIPVVYPGERPPSLTSPTILKSDWETLVIGASGGSFITSAFASVCKQALLHCLSDQKTQVGGDNLFSASFRH